MRNELVIRVQPNESVYCKVSNSKGLQDNHLPFLTADHLTLRSSNFNVTPAFVYLTCLYFYTSTFIPLLFLPLPTSTFIPLWTPTPTFLPLLIYLYILGDDQDPWDVIQPAGDRVGFDLQVQIQVPIFQCFLKSFSVFWGGLFLTDPHSGKPAFLKRMSVSSLTSLSAPRCILSGSLSSQL